MELKNRLKAMQRFLKMRKVLQASILKERSFFYASLHRNNDQYSENQAYDFIKFVSFPLQTKLKKHSVKPS